MYAQIKTMTCIICNNNWQQLLAKSRHVVRKSCISNWSQTKRQRGFSIQHRVSKFVIYFNSIVALHNADIPYIKPSLNYWQTTLKYSTIQLIILLHYTIVQETFLITLFIDFAYNLILCINQSNNIYFRIKEAHLSTLILKSMSI